jgi:hypothetical protein
MRVPALQLRPPRYLFEPPPLGARVITTAIEEIGRAHGLDCPRVAYKKTDACEHCVALSFPRWRRPEDADASTVTGSRPVMTRSPI